MGSIKFNHWYSGSNDLSISLMKFYVSIEICSDGEKIYYKLIVIDENRERLVILFNSLEDAISFTEDEVSECFKMDDILERYKACFEQGKFKSLVKKIDK